MTAQEQWTDEERAIRRARRIAATLEGRYLSFRYCDTNGQHLNLVLLDLLLDELRKLDLALVAFGSDPHGGGLIVTVGLAAPGVP